MCGNAGQGEKATPDAGSPPICPSWIKPRVCLYAVPARLQAFSYDHWTPLSAIAALPRRTSSQPDAGGLEFNFDGSCAAALLPHSPLNASGTVAVFVSR